MPRNDIERRISLLRAKRSNLTDGNSYVIKMIKRPLIPLVISYILGILIGNIYPLSLPLLFSYIACASLLYFVSRRFLPLPGRMGSMPLFLLLPLLLLVSGQAYLTFLNQHRDHYPANHLKNLSFSYPVNLEGRLYTLPEKFPKKTSLYLEISRVLARGLERPVIGRARINVYGPVDRLGLGDEVIVKGVRLYPPKGFRNFDGFDYKKYLAQKGIYALGWIRDESRIEVVARRNGISLIGGIAQLKNKMLSFIDHTTPQAEGAVLKAMVLGDKGFLDRETKQLFKDAGIAHLLVVSGLHVGFVALAFIALVRPLLSFVRFRFLADWPYVLRPSKVAISLSVFPIIFYSLLVGGGYATLRATITALVFLIILLQDRPKDLYSATALAALLLLIWQPYGLFDPGFQLSFVAVLAIAHIVSRIRPIYNKGERIQKTGNRVPGDRPNSRFLSLGFLFPYILVTLFTTVATYPLTAYYFHQVSLVASLANMIIIPLSSFVVPLGLASCGIALVWEPLAQLLLKVDILMVSGILSLAESFISLPSASCRLPTPSLISMLLFYLLLFTVSSYKRRKKVYLWLSLLTGSSLIIALLAQHLSAGRNGLLKVVFLDVGEGDAIFIKTPYGKTMMVDSGGIYSDALDIGEDVIAPFIWNQGFTSVDHMVATHPDRDHIQGFNGLVKNFRVNSFWHNGDPESYHFSEGLDRLINRKEVNFSDLKDGARFFVDHAVLIQVFNLREALAKESGPGNQLNDNNKSLVIKLQYGRISFLLAADIENLAEGYLVDKVKGLRSTFLKVAHHGSRSSSTKKFLEEVKPEIAVISVGNPNPFGHPSPVVLERLKSLRVKVYRTDQHGSIQITTDGQDYSIQTYTQPEG